tara:strand:+ start:903 stop:1079 length:177 start_codon:yes stop_codon:yes gene_type:complete
MEKLMDKNSYFKSTKNEEKIEDNMRHKNIIELLLSKRDSELIFSKVEKIKKEPNLNYN